MINFKVEINIGNTTYIENQLGSNPSFTEVSVSVHGHHVYFQSMQSIGLLKIPQVIVGEHIESAY